jgi:putative ABC transport system substrate-binding protein
MRELGYIEGKNLVIEWRFADGDNERLHKLAAELVGLKVDVIVTAGVPPTSAAAKATTIIPIVMGTATDPLGSGLIKSLAYPGGNITGLSNISVDISSKHLEMLRGMVPTLSRVAVLLDPGTSSHKAILKSIEGAAQKVSTTVLPVEAHTPDDIEKAFAKIVQQGAGAVIVPLSPVFNQRTRHIAGLAAKYRLPSVSGFVEFAEAGGLMSYGQNLTEHYRRSAIYVDKIFKGAKPGDLPVEQSAKFDMVINRKTANALGLKIPGALLIGADRTID